jgi:hypothetical protein
LGFGFVVYFGAEGFELSARSRAEDVSVVVDVAGGLGGDVNHISLRLYGEIGRLTDG